MDIEDSVWSVTSVDIFLRCFSLLRGDLGSLTPRLVEYHVPLMLKGLHFLASRYCTVFKILKNGF